MPNYMSIWKAPAPRARQAPTERRLPPRVKDWPEDARKEFKRVKNELWKWAKKERVEYKGRLALIAYEAVKNEWDGEWERRIEERKNVPVIIIDEMEEFNWTTIKERLTQ